MDADWLLLPVVVVLLLLWLLLTLFFSFIHGYSAGMEALCGGLQPLIACLARLCRRWTPGPRPNRAAGGTSVELLIDGL